MIHIFSYRIRGIYSSAISKLISDAGYELVDVSESLKKRLGLSESKKIYSDANIFDDNFRLGVYCVGNSKSIKTFEKIIKNNLTSPIVIKPLFNKGALISGRIYDIKYNSLLVELPKKMKGEVRFNKRPFSIGDEILVSLLSSYYSRDINFPAKLTTSLIFKGIIVEFLLNYSDFELNKYNGDKRLIELTNYHDLLIELPKRTKLYINKKFQNISENEIYNEITNMVEIIIESLNKFDNSKGLEVIYESYPSLQFIFTPQNKKELDNIRSKIVYTFNSNHFFRSLDEYASNQLDLVEKLIETNSLSETKAIQLMKLYYLEKLDLCENLRLLHIKPDGRIITLGNPIIKESTTNHMMLKRIVKSEGLYDGLEVSKEAGDIILSKIDFSNLDYIKHQYFDQNYNLKGTYWNINTPIEFGIDFIRYIDLILDVVQLPNEKPIIIDKEELDYFVEKKIITKELENHISNISKKILRKIGNEM